MTNEWLTVLLLVGSNVLYHCCQKNLSKLENPMLLLGAAYFVSFVITAPLTLLGGKGKSTLSVVTQSPWAFVGLAIACVGIEGGFLLAYKQGWKLGILSAMVGSISCVSLLAIAALYFEQRVTVTAVLGMVASVVGVILIQVSK